MFPVLLTVHVLVGVLLILVVLVQSGRSGGFSNLMGGGGGDALFSTSGQQSGLRKITIVLAGLFMMTSLGLTMLSSRQSGQSVAFQNFPALPPVNVPTTPSASVPVPNVGGLPAQSATNNNIDSPADKK